MRRFATVPAVFLCLTAAAQVAPEWTRAVGLDVWNLDSEEASLRDAGERQRGLEARHESNQRRSAAAEHVSAGLCDGRLTADEAIETVVALADASPDWLGQLRGFTDCSAVLPTVTDRDLLAAYLLMKIEPLRATAEMHGDAARAAAITSRHARLEAELRPQASALLSQTGSAR